MSNLRIQKGSLTVVKTFRFPDHLCSKLEKISKKNAISMNNLVVQCLNFAMENLTLDENEIAKPH
ncbi:hypothetical protein ATC1_131075 [Flexilinea flocculi]|jgi:Leucine-rich repeat (LRR) protein|uniref:Arc family DNA-binding protein n=1 Tax=Flexilinea flocculi TaxID=1678840 RepID=A0A0S7BKW7_9CHLR|nr:hypothetical protein ATC1_131075 [Flexilinea flocculi]